MSGACTAEDLSSRMPNRRHTDSGDFYGHDFREPRSKLSSRLIKDSESTSCLFCGFARNGF
jgi:hypothetical protein